MNPIKGLGKIFSIKGLVELAKSLLNFFFSWDYIILCFAVLSARDNKY